MLVSLYSAGETTKLSQANLKLSAQGQITDRFVKAIDELGSDILEVRLGGIYALQRIAKDSERDRDPILEILAAFVRAHVPRHSSDDLKESSPVRTDVQAALTAIGRVPPQGDVARQPRLDLTGGLDLRGYSLMAGHFEGLAMMDALFMGYAAGVQLQGADLRGSILALVDFSRGNLEHAVIRGCNLMGANLAGANLREANLVGTSLYSANLSGANLQRTRISANFDKARLVQADLGGAILSDSTNIDVDPVDGTSLRRFNPSGKTSLKATDFEGANLSGTDLRGVDLSEAKNLT